MIFNIFDLMMMITVHYKNIRYSLTRVYFMLYCGSSRINDECLVNDGVKMLTMTFVVAFFSIQLYSMYMYACTGTKQNQLMTTVAVVFYVVRQNEQTKKKEIKEEFDRQRQMLDIKRRFYINVQLLFNRYRYRINKLRSYYRLRNRFFFARRCRLMTFL
jgi:hypothetical protein